jgi:mono/diheme cytochrome c family protein
MKFGVLSLGVLLLAAAAPAAPQEDTALVDQGRAAFRRVGCANCHRLRGVGTGLASELSHVGAKYTAAYLERWLKDPREIRPSGHMPALELSDDDVRALAAFLAAQRSAK